METEKQRKDKGETLARDSFRTGFFFAFNRFVLEAKNSLKPSSYYFLYKTQPKDNEFPLSFSLYKRDFDYDASFPDLGFKAWKDFARSQSEETAQWFEENVTQEEWDYVATHDFFWKDYEKNSVKCMNLSTNIEYTEKAMMRSKEKIRIYALNALSFGKPIVIKDSDGRLTQVGKKTLDGKKAYLVRDEEGNAIHQSPCLEGVLKAQVNGRTVSQTLNEAKRITIQEYDLDAQDAREPQEEPEAES